MVARDNGYFLAREKLREVEVKLYQARQNDYNRVLPLFPTLDEATVATFAADLEDVVKKASLPIQHRAGSDWTDDAYLLIGKSRYYKMEYEDAAKTFKYVNSISKDADAKHEALIWLMRTFLAGKELENAKAVSDILDKEEGREVNARELFLTRADYYLKTGEPEKAIVNLELAVPLVEPKNERSRTRYILAQLYQTQGDDKKAYAELNKILKKNPPYELDFFSKLMLGQVSDLNDNDKARLDKYFAKLLKDTKNKEYRDKIYYEMARLNYRQQHYEEALALLRQSARANGANKAQKSYTYLLAGRIYYENLQKYRLAASYYDSTVQNLSKEAPDYAAISERAGILKDFAQQATIIETQDSLQLLARLDTATLRTRLTTYADAEIEGKRKAAEALAAKQERDNDRQATAGISTSRDLQTDINPEDFINGSTGAKWYFDNPAALGTARADFIRKWGERPLQDNWRTVTTASASPVTARGGNAPAGTAGANQANGTAGAVAAVELDPAVQRKALVAQYRKALPLTSTQMEASEKQIEEAMYALGGIYNQQLRELVPAAQTYEKLLPRFPNTAHTPEIYYSLYLIYKQQNDSARYKSYAQALREEFPTSAYTRLAADPEYLRRTSLVNKEVAIQVDSAFVLYKDQNFKKASAMLARTSKKFPESDLNDRIAYLNTLIDLRTQPPLTARASLEKFLRNYEQSPLSNEARLLLGSYKRYETGSIEGALASTQKPTVSMFRPGEVYNRMRIAYDGSEMSAQAAPTVVATPNSASPPNQPQPPTGEAPTQVVPTDSAAVSNTVPASSAPAIDPVKAARMAAAQARVKGKKLPKPAPVASTEPVAAVPSTSDPAAASPITAPAAAPTDPAVVPAPAPTASAPAIDPVKAARMAAAQARAKGKKLPAPIPTAAVAASAPAATSAPVPTGTPSTTPPASPAGSAAPTTTPGPSAATKTSPTVAPQARAKETKLPVPAPATSTAAAPATARPPASAPVAAASTPVAPAPTSGSAKPASASLYATNLAGAHAVVLIFPKAAAPLQGLPIQISTYNNRFFKASNLQVQQQALGDSLELIVVQGLAGARIAQGYAVKLRGPQSPLSRLRGAGYQTLVIGIDNLPLLLQRRNLEEYEVFYQQTYR